MTTLITMLVLALPITPPTDAASTVARAAPQSVCIAKAKKLERFIVKTNPRTKKWAAKLARAILREAKRFKLAPALFAAIAFNESWFDINVRGTSYEHGAFQLWPWGSYMRPAFDRMRTVFQGKGMSDKDWDKLTRKEQIAMSRNPRTAAFMAAYLLAYHMKLCRSQNKARCAAAYNSGNWRKVRPGYMSKLRRRSKAIRKALNK